MSIIVPLTSAADPPAHPARAASGGIDEIAESLALQLAATAVQRDRAGGHAAAERELIRSSGLLALTVPAEFGGLGGDWAGFYRVVRRLAQADSALAHVFAFHHLQLATVRLFGNATQQSQLLRETIERRAFWGNALNPTDTRAFATEAEGGWHVEGLKSFCSGSVGSDYLCLSAWHHGTQSALVAAVPTLRRGIAVAADWDAFGQRQTDSGTVSFDKVFIAHDEVLQAPGTAPTPRGSLRPLVSQLILANLYIGIAQGAFDEARRYTREHTRPWSSSGVDRATNDPFVQHRYAELWLLIRPAAALADEAAQRLDAAFKRGASLTAEDRGAVAIAVAEAKVLAHRASVEVSSQLFELTGARSTSERHGLDRFWRNARVHTLHDPVDYKLRDLGRYLLDGRVPEPTPYS